MTEIWFDSSGTKLFALAGGDGPPIILCHGGLANHQICWRFGAPLAERFHLITPDLRGSGRSIYRESLGWDQLADDIAELVRHLGLPRAVIGGVSFGSGVAVRTALRHPEITAALVLLHPAFGGVELGFTPAQQQAMQAMDAVGRRAVSDGIEVMFPLLDTLPADLRERARATLLTYDPASVATTTRFMASGAQPFAAAELAAIAARTLVVPGIDPYHPREVADVYRTHIAHCTVREADLSQFAEVIAAFLE